MSVSDYLLSFLLASLVVRQVRGKKLSVVGLCWPVAIVVVAAIGYLAPVPAGPVDIALVATGIVVGTMLGVGCAALTRVLRNPDGELIARASGLAAVLWVAGCLCRVEFELYAEHGGGPSIARFDASHHLAPAAWTAALVLMALAEVLGRTAVLALRMLWMRRGRGSAQLVM